MNQKYIIFTRYNNALVVMKPRHGACLHPMTPIGTVGGQPSLPWSPLWSIFHD